MNSWKTVALCAAIAMMPVQAKALDVIINSFDNGWYMNTGFHQVNTPNTLTGFGGDLVQNRTFRSWYGFNIAIIGPISAASITFYGNNGKFQTNTGSETVGLFDYTGDVGSLTLGMGGVAAYDDLGTGVQLGEHTIVAPNDTDMPQFTVALSDDFVAQYNTIRTSADPRIAIGAALTTIEEESAESFWAFSTRLPAAFLTVTLAGTDVPEPAAITLLGAGLAALGITARRRRMA